MKKLGLQLILELCGCNPDELNNESFVTHKLLGAAEILGAHILKSYFHQYHPQGVTGIVVIAESHLSVHTWPEYNYAAIDIFTCGVETKPYESANYLIEMFKPDQHYIQEIDRGSYGVYV